MNAQLVNNTKLLSIAVTSLFVFSGLIGCAKPQRQAHAPEKIGIHAYQIDGLTVRTGDLICTTTGGAPLLRGFFYRVFGMLIPGPVDHIAVYIGPGGRCVEAGAKLRVITFDVAGNTWDASEMIRTRGPILDALYGVAYPLAGRSLSGKDEAGIREAVATYCLTQAEAGKPYNIMFVDSTTEDAFYCSQLAYRAYLNEGIDLNTGRGVPRVPGTESIVMPQEIWNGCEHEKLARRAARQW
jgi:hypothetical protein